MWTTVYEYERAVRYRNGRLAGVLEPGRHLRLPFSGTRAVRVDLRARVTNVPGQELLTADGVTVRVSLAARWRVTDPVAFVQGSADPVAALYLALQLALRDAVGGVAAEALLTDRGSAAGGLAAGCAAQAAEVGVELETVAIRDVMFPGELKRVFAQVAAARQEGLAALERARGETAALRSLANAAKLLDASPALLQLRTIQAANTVVVTR